MTWVNEHPEQYLEGLTVFLSASIPNPRRWEGAFNPLEITDAVVALTRTFLGVGARLVSAAHPTIAPLLLYVASELPPADMSRKIVIYQSRVFDAVLPEATRRFEAEGIGSIVRTEAVAGEPPDPQRAPRSLDLMRRQMLNETRPSAAVLVGGMDGITVESALMAELLPDAPTYPLGRPGGAALGLAREDASPIHKLLLDGDVYTKVARAIVGDIYETINS